MLQRRSEPGAGIRVQQRSDRQQLRIERLRIEQLGIERRIDEQRIELERKQLRIERGELGIQRELGIERCELRIELRIEREQLRVERQLRIEQRTELGEQLGVEQRQLGRRCRSGQQRRRRLGWPGLRRGVHAELRLRVGRLLALPRQGRGLLHDAVQRGAVPARLQRAGAVQGALKWEWE
jgi:hypothetical protein